VAVLAEPHQPLSTLINRINPVFKLASYKSFASQNVPIGQKKRPYQYLWVQPFAMVRPQLK
jgi:hypothetical protein